MGYRVYGNKYFTGWEKINKKGPVSEDVAMFLVDTMDPRDYSEYMVIRNINNGDEVVSRGFLDRPVEITKKKKR